MFETRKILFVCIENAGRSQMAEGFFRKYAPKGYEPVSAGTKPIHEINSHVIQVMEEVGIDISKQHPKMLTNEIIKESVLIINMGCMDKTECPALFIKNYIDWSIEDPKSKQIDKIRKIRDIVELKVRELCKTLA